MTLVFWYFVGAIGFLFVLGVVIVFVTWVFGTGFGRAQAEAEFKPEIRLLQADNKRMKELLDSRPYRALGPVEQRALPPGTEYTRTDKWKAMPAPAEQGGN